MNEEIKELEISEEAIRTPDNDAAMKHPVAAYISGLQSPLSRYVMQRDLRNLAKLMSGGALDEWDYPWQQLRFQHLNALKTKLLETQSHVTVNKKLSAVKGVLKAAWRLELIDSDTYHRTVDVERARGETLPKGRSISRGELLALFAVCAEERENNPVIAARDAALFAVMYSVAGPRRSEIVALQLSDYDPETGRLVIRNGKGNKQRTNYLGKNNIEALNAWLEFRGNEPGALFCSVFKGGRLGNLKTGMSSQAVWKIVERRAEQAGVKSITPHDFRRTVAGDLLDAGEDISTVKKLLGHSSVATTERYDRRSERRKAKAAQLIHLPYAS